MDTAQLTFILNTLHLETGVQNAKYIPLVYKRVFLAQANHEHKKLFSNYLLEANKQIEMTYIFFNVVGKLLRQSYLEKTDSGKWSFNNVVIKTIENYNLSNHFHDYLISVISGNKIVKLPGACDLPIKLFMGLAMEAIREIIPIPGAFDSMVTDYDLIVQTSANEIDNIEIRPTHEYETADKDIASVFMDEMQDYTDALKLQREEENHADTMIIHAGGNTIRMRSLSSNSITRKERESPHVFSSRSLPKLNFNDVVYQADADNEADEDALSVGSKRTNRDSDDQISIEDDGGGDSDDDDDDSDDDSGNVDDIDDYDDKNELGREEIVGDMISAAVDIIQTDEAESGDVDVESTTETAINKATSPSDDADDASSAAAIDKMFSKFVYKPYTAADLVSFSFRSSNES